MYHTQALYCSTLNLFSTSCGIHDFFFHTALYKQARGFILTSLSLHTKTDRKLKTCAVAHFLLTKQISGNFSKNIDSRGMQLTSWAKHYFKVYLRDFGDKKQAV